MSNDESLRQKVRDMAKLSMLTNRLSEIQEYNFKMYPFVFFENVESAEIKYDISNDLDVKIEEDHKNVKIGYKFETPDTKHLRVSFHLKLDERLNGNLEKRFKAIEESVRTILWSQIMVEVFFNGKKVYGSENV